MVGGSLKKYTQRRIMKLIGVLIEGFWYLYSPFRTKEIRIEQDLNHSTQRIMLNSL